MSITITPRSRAKRSLVRGGIIGGAVVAVSLLAASPALALTSITSGSYDAIEVGLDGSQLVVGGHDHGTGNEFDPSTVQFESSSLTIAQNGTLSLGVAAEGDLYDELGGAGSEVTFEISDFSGPGDLSVNATGSSAIFNTATGDLAETVELSDPSSTGEDESFHQHYNWVFTQAGTYTFEVTAIDETGTASDSDPVSYTFVIG